MHGQRIFEATTLHSHPHEMKGLMGRFRVQIKPGMDIILRSTRVVVS